MINNEGKDMTRVAWAVFAAACFGLVMAAIVGTPAHAQYFMELAPGGQESAVNPTIVLRDRETSAVNTAQTFTYDIRGIVNVVAVVMTCSAAGTATVTISGSSDNVNYTSPSTVSWRQPRLSRTIITRP